jgi:urease accessory protein UreF
MADIIITIPDVIIPRIKAALNVTDSAAIQTWIKNQLKQQVASFEGINAFQQKAQAIKGENWL